MPFSGPVFAGLPQGLYAAPGLTIQPFAAARLTDAASQQISLTVTLSDPGAGALFDPQAATDGSSYDPATGVYKVSGTPASVSLAIEGLQWVAPNPTSSFLSVNVSATDGKGNVDGPSVPIVYLSGQSYTGGGQTITLPTNVSPAFVALSHTGGVADVVTAADPFAVVAVSSLTAAQAVFKVGAILYVSAGDAARLESGGWNTAYGDDAAFTLDGADLSVVGNHAEVGFASGTDDAVSFWGPGAGYVETVTGSDGTVIANGVEVGVTGDGDTVYFEGAGNTLDLTAATAQAWSALYASGGTVNLAGASLAIYGGGVTVNVVFGDGAVSLYGGGGAPFTINGSGVPVTLNGATVATVNGGGDAIWFEGGSGSVVTTNSAATAPDVVYGAGTVDVASGAVDSVGGGALIAFQTTGESAAISHTNGFWDRVQEAPGVLGGTVQVTNAQTSVVGGGMNVVFAGSDDAASLYATGGNWDAVYGSADSLVVDGAQANLFGVFGDVYLQGAGVAVSFYDDSFSETPVIGSDAVVVLAAYAFAEVSGGADTVYMDGRQGYSSVLLENTNGAWDAVYAQSAVVRVSGAQASVVGADDTISFSGVGDAVSLYDTGGSDDTVEGQNGGAVSLTDARATLYGQNCFLYSGGGVNAYNLSYSEDNALVLNGAFGTLSVAGFNSSDFLILSKSEFANFQAFAAALKDTSAGATLTLDANDTATFTGLSKNEISAAQVQFV